MRKLTLIGISALLIAAILTACGCQHEWQAANCTTPKTCSLCSATEGAPEHTYEGSNMVCTVCGLDQRPVDAQFLDSLVQGLEARWVLTDATDGAAIITKTEWREFFAAEYEHIESFSAKEFEDKELEKWAKRYIQSISDSTEALKHYGTNLWENAYKFGAKEDRAVALYNIHKAYPLSVPSSRQNKLQEILIVGEAINMVPDILEDIKFRKEYDSVTKETTYYTYLNNTTDITFTTFKINVNLLDSNDNLIQTYGVYATNWQTGKEYRFAFTTPLNFDNFTVEFAYCFYN